MDSLDKRVSRIMGQMRGIQKMVKDKREGTDILQQVASVKKAIDGLTKEIISHYIQSDITPSKHKELMKLLSQVIDL